ncbi:hypothetical protein OK074_4303 [Actinobacteria bacterium OK074]|nr:hypothetical protein OK074_4303 [Actinobacteria bacterium OK074]
MPHRLVCDRRVAPGQELIRIALADGRANSIRIASGGDHVTELEVAELEARLIRAVRDAGQAISDNGRTAWVDRRSQTLKSRRIVSPRTEPPIASRNQPPGDGAVGVLEQVRGVS